MIEMGILAPFLWLLWTGALMITGWRVVLRLRETRLFPIGFAILWYAFLLLFPLTDTANLRHLDGILIERKHLVKLGSYKRDCGRMLSDAPWTLTPRNFTSRLRARIKENETK